MPRVTASDIRMAARMMASDADLMKRFQLTAEQLEKYRDHIEVGRAAAVIAAKYNRSRAVARKAQSRASE